MKRTLILLLLLGSWGAQAADTTPTQLQAQWTATAGTTPSPARGQQFFTTTHGGEWSCASCHGNPPTSGGKHASTGKRVAEEPPQDRITRSAWFERKHRHIEPAVWKLASVKSAANCAACHTGADKGQYDDDHLRFPAGLTARQRLTWYDSAQGRRT